MAALYELAARGVIGLLLLAAAVLAHQWRCDCRRVRPARPGSRVNPGQVIGA